MKPALDAWVYQEVIAETRPEVIIELSWDEGPGPLVATRKFVAETPEFEVDRRRSPLGSANPEGYLLRR